MNLPSCKGKIVTRTMQLSDGYRTRGRKEVDGEGGGGGGAEKQRNIFPLACYQYP